MAAINLVPGKYYVAVDVEGHVRPILGPFDERIQVLQANADAGRKDPEKHCYAARFSEEGKWYILLY